MSINNTKDFSKTPTRTYIDKYLGRYECTVNGHNKFWECLYDSGEGYNSVLIIRWGKIGAKKPQCSRTSSFHELHNKIQNKINKGYVFIPYSFKTLVAVDHHAISQALEENFITAKSSIIVRGSRKI